MRIAVLALTQLAVLALSGCSDKTASGTTNPAPIPQQTKQVTPEPVAAKEPITEVAEPKAEVPEPKAEKVVRAPAFPIDPASLDSWATPRSTATFILHAADADTHLLSIAAADNTTQLLGLSSAAEQVSGRLEVKSAKAMWKGLQANVPGLSALQLKSPRGKGRKIDLSYWHASPNDLMQLFAAVFGTNIVMPRVNEPITIQIHRLPVDQAQGALAKSLGWHQTRHGRTTFVTPEPWVVDKKFQGGAKVKIDLDVNDAKASDVLGLLSAIKTNNWTATCGAGTAFSLRLKRESVGTIAAALTLLSGEELSRTAKSCVEEATEIPTDKDKLLAIVTNGKNSAALFESAGDKPVVVRNGHSYGGKRVRVGRGFVAFGSVNDEIGRFLYPSEHSGKSFSEEKGGMRPFYEQLGDLLRRSRLAATVVRPKSQAAIFEMPSGQFFMMMLGNDEPLRLYGDVGFDKSLLGSPLMMRQPFEIVPGKLQIETQKPGLPRRTESIPLSKRP